MNRPKSSYEDIRQGLEEFIHNPDALTRYEYPEPDVRAIREGMDLPLQQANKQEQDAFGASFDTEDQAEGMAAFLEKRSPDWQHK